MNANFDGKGSHGFTLVEVLVSLACMAIAFVSLLALHVASVKVDSANNLETIATNLANQQLENLRATPFASLTSSSDQPRAPFNRTWTVTIPASFPWRAEVLVTVSWTEALRNLGGNKLQRSRSVWMRSYIVNTAVGS